MTDTGLDTAISASEALDALRRSITEEADALRKLVNDEDSDCVSRNLRAERVSAYEHVLRIVDAMGTWEW